MANLTYLSSFSSESGSLSVLERVLPTPFERFFYINNLSSFARGGHKHRFATIVLGCIQGSCKVEVKDTQGNTTIFFLASGNEFLIIEPMEWHQMYDFLPNTILVALSDKIYDANDYIYEK